MSGSPSEINLINHIKSQQTVVKYIRNAIFIKRSKNLKGFASGKRK